MKHSCQIWSFNSFPNFVSDVINGRGRQENIMRIELESCKENLCQDLSSEATFLYVHFQLAL